MVELPEQQQTEALTRVAQISGDRDTAQAEVDRLTETLREAAVHAARTGAGRTRIRQLAKVSSRTLYTWLEDAGVEIRRA